MIGLALAPLLAAALDAAPAPLPEVRPEKAGMSSARLAPIDAAVAEAIAKGEVPGVVLLVGRRGQVVLRKAYGARALVPAREPMTVDTVFDLASLTKVVATAPSVMALVERGAVKLSDRVVTHLPAFGGGGGEREKVTVEELLLHRGGLPADDPMSLYLGTPDEIFARKYREPLVARPGETFLYSDVGFEVLGELVRRVSGEPLDVFARKALYEPLGMRDTGFRPLGQPGGAPLERIAPTERLGGEIARGRVHDPRAFALGGVAGHAGLFSTADDLARYAVALLGDGGGALAPATVAALTRPRFTPDGVVRALGWDVGSSFSSNRGDLFPLGSYGHTGWTGTSLWIDPFTGVFVVLLTSRTHPDGSGNAGPLRTRVATLVAASVTDIPAATLRAASERFTVAVARARALRPTPSPTATAADVPAQVLAGIDALEADGFKALAGKRVALLTNQTGTTRDGRSTIDALRSGTARGAGVTLLRLFSPEHGIRGQLDAEVSDEVDAASGLSVHSLYGATRRPRPGDLEGLDAVVVDLQDAGCRFYTYLTTLGYVLEEAAKAKVAVVVLDRPNPIGAVAVEGPPADEDQLSFTAYHTIPIRTGMTIGELATLFNAERRLGADLTVVKMRGYRRSLWYDETGLLFTNPSPNLRSVTAAALYPGVALLEMTNLSVGRGTDTPFEVIGAPWLDGESVARTLSSRGIRGVRFTPVRFTPNASTWKGEACRGVRITLVDRDALDAVGLGLEIVTALRDRHPKEWDRTKLGKLLASAAALRRIERGESAAQVASGWAATRMEFERRRARFLLY